MMNIKRVTIPLSEDEMSVLTRQARDAERLPKHHARYLVLAGLATPSPDIHNDSSSTVTTRPNTGMDFLHVQYQVITTKNRVLTRSAFVEVVPCKDRSDYDRYIAEIYEMLSMEIENSNRSHMVDESSDYTIATVSKLVEGMR